MKSVPETLLSPANSNDPAPALDARTRARLGRQLQKVYAPVLNKQLDPHLSALLQQLKKAEHKVPVGD